MTFLADDQVEALKTKISDPKNGRDISVNRWLIREFGGDPVKAMSEGKINGIKSDRDANVIANAIGFNSTAEIRGKTNLNLDSYSLLLSYENKHGELKGDNRLSDILETSKEHMVKAVEVAKDKGREVADVVRDRMSDLAETIKNSESFRRLTDRDFGEQESKLDKVIIELGNLSESYKRLGRDDKVESVRGVIAKMAEHLNDLTNGNTLDKSVEQKASNFISKVNNIGVSNKSLERDEIEFDMER